MGGGMDYGWDTGRGTVGDSDLISNEVKIDHDDTKDNNINDATLEKGGIDHTGKQRRSWCQTWRSPLKSRCRTRRLP